MSPFIKTKEPGWISSDQLERPSQAKLAIKDSEAFLEFLFSDVAHKPMPIRLWEAASVAKYLQALSREQEPGPDRQALDYLAEVVWHTALRVAPIELGTKQDAASFLERHAGTHLPVEAAEKAVRLVRDRRTPNKPIKPPRLISRGMSIEGDTVAGLQDDLSERIYAAYWALRQAKIHGARGQVAAILNAKGLSRSSRGGRSKDWDSDTVFERVKQFEERQLPKQRRTQVERKQVRTAFVGKWVDAFRFRREVAGA